MTNEKVFELGERRRVTLEVWLSNGQTFTPNGAHWVLTPLKLPPEAEGEAEAREENGRWLLTAEVQPKKCAVYSLQYSFGLGTEIIKRSVQIKVI